MSGTPGRNWFQAFLLVMCIGAGYSGLTAPPRSTDIAFAFPRWGVLIWFGGLIAFGLVALFGVIRHNLTGLQAERGAMLGLAGLCFGFTTTATILCLIKDGASVYTTTLTFAFGILCMSRVWQIRHEIQGVLADLKRMGDAVTPPRAQS